MCSAWAARSGRIQQNGQFTVNANGIPVVSRVTANCS
jgi:hypothetical protein